jgi:Alpha/beta hydrolase domain
VVERVLADDPPRVTTVDFRPEADRGIATTLPPVVGKSYRHLGSAVDQDGNEVDGIRLPDLMVSLATYLGLNLRHPGIGAPEQLMSLIGATILFSRTRKEREARGTRVCRSRSAIPSRPITSRKCGAPVHALVEDGWLLAEESDFLVENVMSCCTKACPKR